jgi:DNA repair exonuclease SbcCD nuclease subunit
MTRLIHTGDTHIGYQQYHSPERRDDFLAAFETVVEDAIAEDVDALVHAGDLFHDSRPDLAALQGVVALLRRLDDAGVPFLGVVGNHEGMRGGQWLDLFADIGLATRLDSEGLVVGDTTLYGLDHVPRSQRAALDYDFAPPETKRTALVAHGLFEPFAHADWDTGAMLEQATVEFDAVLLGDNHEPGRAEVDGTLVTYCGSTERASASEEAARGYNIVAFTDDDTVRLSRRAIDDAREFVYVDVELHEGEGAERVREQVRQHDVADAVVIVTITGAGEPVPSATIEETAADAGALLARVRDRREAAEEEVDFDVDFADPDAAVDERLRDVGLSTAARDIDDVVRGPTADSNVRETVKRRVEERIEDGPAAFERADTEDAETTTATDPEESADDTADTAAEATDGDTDGQASMEEYL